MPIHLPDTFNVATYFVDRNLREGRGEKIAIECGDEKVTYQQLLERTDRVGNALKKLGVRPGDRVVLVLPDIPQFFYCFFGAIKIGAIAVPTNTWLKPADYEYMLNDTQAPVAVVGQELLPNLTLSTLPHLRNIIVVGRAGPPHLALHDLMASASPHLDAHPTHKNAPAFWLYSSGSTGFPKGCVHLHHDMVVTSELYAKNILHMDESDRCYSVARLFFAYGLGNAGYFPLACGATTILSPARPTPAGVFADIERYKPTLFFSVPTNYAALLDHHRDGKNKDFDLSSLRQAVSAGEALPAPLFERFEQRFGVEILDALGSTETLHMVTSNLPGQARPGSSGKIIPGYEARIVDESGASVPPGEIGMLLVKCDATCNGYWKQPEKTRAAFDGDWFRTGDKYSQDADGYLWYAGRSDDMFKVNGSWVSPAQVESALVSHPSVREAAVVAREDDAGLSKPAAYVVLKSDAAPGDDLVRALQDCVAEKIGGFKRPRWIEFLPELPKTATGKLQRFKLRELHQEQKPRL